MTSHRMRLLLILLIVLCLVLGAMLPARAELPELIGRIVSDTTRTLFGTTIVPLGDQNGDGYADIMVWDYRPAAYLYYGGYPLDTIYDLRINEISPFIGNLGDIDLDGYDDFAATGREPSSWKLDLYLGGPDLDTVRDLWFGLDTLLPGGSNPIRTLDINVNGQPEIFSREGWDLHRVLLYELGDDADSVSDLVLTPANIGDGVYAFGDRIITGDFNGDDTSDLVVNLRPGPNENEKGSLQLYWGGADFDTLPDLVIPEPGEYQNGSYQFGFILASLGDVNADGYEDIYASAGSPYYDTLGWVFFGGPDIDAIPDITTAKRYKNLRTCGDINDDGYPDFIAGFPLPYAGGWVDIFFGGPDLDSIPDITIYPGDIDDYNTYFGMDCAGVGDVNGDGIDDFAFSSVISSGYAAVYVFAGAADPVDVDEEPPPLLPEEYELYQNYPNPFNGSTTIEFVLRRRGTVNLEVYNILGETVISVVSGTLSAGRHVYQWDGCDSGGLPVSSGVYLYRLETGDHAVSRKMVLLK